ncbi:MAG: outer membrane protein assembly factor BamD [Burkholderiales bacterium]|nr:outer membrane protein assembly factor BamD [Burkholderiales bacterium]
MRRSVVAALVATAVLIAACGSSVKPDESATWPADRLYREAKEELEAGNYKKAVQYYEKLEARFPYGQYAQQSQLEAAYAYFKDNERASAVAAADRFIKLYPNHPNVDYAHYIKGLISFNEDLGIIAKFSNQDMAERDPQAMRESFDALQQLVTKFPDSRYTPDALQRLQYLVNAMAGGEVRTAEYYLRRKAYVAAVNRAQYAIDNYPRAPALRGAFDVLVDAYAAMGLTDLQKDAERLRQLNFPEDTRAAQAPEPGFLDRLWPFDDEPRRGAGRVPEEPAWYEKLWN